MHDVVVVKAAHDVRDGVAFADVGEELVAEAFALARTGHKTGDVDEFHGGGHDALGRDDFGELFKTRIGHFHDAHIGFDRAKREICRLRLRITQTIK